MATPTYTKSGSKATTAAKLDKAVFGVEVASHSLLKQAYNTYLANGRENLAKTLRRGEVRGGGKKPWKQKGTGRARFGSIRVPIWRGGGITFGPLGEENYSKKLSTSAKRTAIRQALTLKAQADRVIVVEALSLKDGKAKDASTLLKKIGASRSVLVVVEDKTPEIVRAFSNLEGVTLSHAMYVNVYDVMNADYVVISEKALTIITEWLGKKEAK
ncbi:50S ribosomal protein L4 [Candidatus Saccharibacteria bacterium]|nr:50S ribosomal protein L4 [Candidatus Saccharibacteria bacterium]MCA9328233.1 50S ribosomal protein L4 [Candidatus Saccharibacteria bacterium]